MYQNKITTLLINKDLNLYGFSPTQYYFNQLFACFKAYNMSFS